MRQVQAGRECRDLERVPSEAAIVVVEERSGRRPVTDQLMRVDCGTDDERRGGERPLREVCEDGVRELDRRIIGNGIVDDAVDVLRRERGIETKMIASRAADEDVVAE